MRPGMRRRGRTRTPSARTGRGAREERGAAREERDRRPEPVRAPPLGPVGVSLGPHPADEHRRRGIERGGDTRRLPVDRLKNTKPATNQQSGNRNGAGAWPSGSPAARAARRRSLAPRQVVQARAATPGRKRLHGRNPVVKSPRYWYQGPWCTQPRAYRSDLLVDDRLAQVAEAVARDGRPVPAEHDRGEDEQAGPEPEPPGDRAQRPGQGEVAHARQEREDEPEQSLAHHREAHRPVGKRDPAGAAGAPGCW